MPTAEQQINLRPCDCGAVSEGPWADVHAADCASMLIGPLRPAEVETALDRAMNQIDAAFATSRMIVNSVDRGEGVFFWEIRSPYQPAVEAEIMRLQQAAGVVHSEFHRPWREAPWWRATGFTQVATAPGRGSGPCVSRVGAVAVVG